MFDVWTEDEKTLERYKNYLRDLDREFLVNRLIKPLIGFNLACWCPLDSKTCHADVLLALVSEHVNNRGDNGRKVTN